MVFLPFRSLQKLLLAMFLACENTMPETDSKVFGMP